MSQTGTEVCDTGLCLHGLLTFLDTVVDMFARLGLSTISSVYKAVKRHQSVNFKVCNLWQTCHLSGISARCCLQVGKVIFVHPQHAKWVHCVWLCSHISDQDS